MPSQLSTRLEERQELADAVRAADHVVIPMLQRHSSSASAFWDVAEDVHSRDVLTLYLTDPWGSAADDFAPNELQDERKLERRVNELIGEMILPRRPGEPRERIELVDTLTSADQLEQLRMRLGQIPDIGRARLQLHNQVRLLPRKPEKFLLTDFAIEVDEPFAETVRKAVAGCGFRVREDVVPIKRQGVREGLSRLIDQHFRDGEPKPDFALCFRLGDRQTIHLLEVSREAVAYGDGGLDGFGFSARGLIPHAYSLKLYLANPEDLRVAARVNPDHPLLHDLRSGNCEFLRPDDGGEAFRREFPDLMRA